MNVLIRGNFRTYLGKQHVSISAPEAHNENESDTKKKPTKQECHTTYLSYYLS